MLAPFSADRTFAFSSFDADAALHARRIQHFHPVFFLTCAQKSENLCPRRRTIDAALDVAIDGGLDGVVLDVDEFLSAPPGTGQRARNHPKSDQTRPAGRRVRRGVHAARCFFAISGVGRGGDHHGRY